LLWIEKKYHEYRKVCQSDQEAFGILERNIYLVASLLVACGGNIYDFSEKSNKWVISNLNPTWHTFLGLIYLSEDGWNHRLVRKGLMTAEQFAAKQTKDFVEGKAVGKAQAAGAHFGGVEGMKLGM